MFIANWKMNKTQAEAKSFCERFLKLFRSLPGNEVDVVLAPPYTSIECVGEMLGGAQGVELGAQNVHWLVSGAQTGEVSAAMLREIGVTHVILGHSERRQYYGETSKCVAARVLAAVKHQLRAIVCIGESGAQYEQGITREVVYEQLVASLDGLKAEHTSSIVIAYEPVWAVGTGRAATPEIIAKVHSQIHDILAKLFGKKPAAAIQILYGGSTTPENIYDIVSKEHVGGALVGGASLDPETFHKLIIEGRRGLAARAKS